MTLDGESTGGNLVVTSLLVGSLPGGEVTISQWSFPTNSSTFLIYSWLSSSKFLVIFSFHQVLSLWPSQFLNCDTSLIFDEAVLNLQLSFFAFSTRVFWYFLSNSDFHWNNNPFFDRNINQVLSIRPNWFLNCDTIHGHMQLVLSLIF